MRIWVALVFLVACRDKQAAPRKEPERPTASDAARKHELVNTMLAVGAHAVILKDPASNFTEYRDVVAVAERAPGVVAAEAFCYAPVNIPLAGGRLRSISLKGVDPVRVDKVHAIAQHMTSGSLALSGKPPGIVLGDVLAQELGVKVNDEIAVPSLYDSNVRTFRVTGTFHYDFPEWDGDLAIASFADVADLRGRGDVAYGVEVALKDPDAPEPAVNALKATLTNYIVKDWREVERDLTSGQVR